MLSVTALLFFWVSLGQAAIPSSTTVGSDLWLLFQNDLDWHTTAEHESSILLSAHTHAEALVACAKLNEGLTPTNGTFFQSDIKNTLAYVALETGASPTQKYWINGPTLTHNQLCASVSTSGLSSTACTEELPVLCANSAPNKLSNQTDLSPAWQVQVTSENLSITGTRDHLSFRFLGIPYADEPARWTYSSLYTGSPTISALTFGSPCAQPGSTGMENCLFLNIFTPVSAWKIEVSNQTKTSGFTNGEGSDSNFDGGNLASRGDVVVVTINYRLGALGFLALDDGVTNGNYGIADQITALKWVQAHLASFGGDPSRVTIFGQSAGAGSVRALLGSPPAFGLFAGAIAQSNLGGFAYASTYSEYFTIEQEVEIAAGAFVGEVGCAKGTSSEVLACLREVPWQTLQNAPDAPRYVVVDGTFIKRDRLSVDGKGPVASNAHVIFGWMAGDGLDFAGSYPQSTTTQAASIEGIPISANLTTAILESGLFPRPFTGNETLDTFNVTARVATDGEFRCIDQATAHSANLHSVFASMWSYQFERAYNLAFASHRRRRPIPLEIHPFPYFQCHSGELYFVFGTLGEESLPFRDELDLPFEQLTVDTWSAFARAYNPNPSQAFLEARGYTGTAAALKEWGPWEDVKSQVPVRILAWPSRGSGWIDTPQCEVVGFPLDFFED
ncbi:Cholinesterase [Mycena sanguinolenta]|uniref:Carboxylic ester hydrolase n=1 Tax=Mycena sanguinolenta TaxID=230812 RepID=A0A8H7DG23_9AGAR|nr:Cholinesterase [Mycena sanguinolenta]